MRFILTVHADRTFHAVSDFGCEELPTNGGNTLGHMLACKVEYGVYDACTNETKTIEPGVYRGTYSREWGVSITIGKRIGDATVEVLRKEAGRLLKLADKALSRQLGRAVRDLADKLEAKAESMKS
jgi:hypothetical protein